MPGNVEAQTLVEEGPPANAGVHVARLRLDVCRTRRPCLSAERRCRAKVPVGGRPLDTAGRESNGYLTSIDFDLITVFADIDPPILR